MRFLALKAYLILSIEVIMKRTYNKPPQQKRPVDNITRFPTERPRLTMEEMAKRAHLGEPKTVTVRIDGV